MSGTAAGGCEASPDPGGGGSPGLDRKVGWEGGTSGEDRTVGWGRGRAGADKRVGRVGGPDKEGESVGLKARDTDRGRKGGGEGLKNESDKS